MAIKPILFNALMIRALLEGRKTQTRRVVKPQPPLDLTICRKSDGMHPGSDGRLHWTNGFQLEFWPGGLNKANKDMMPPYQPGDVLWCRETTCAECGGDPCYRADADFCGMTGEQKPPYGGWTPSIHMPKWACRLFLRVTNVRVERVQDISEEDARAEGVDLKNGIGQLCPRSAFRRLWDSINAKRGYGWGVNPWVWVYEFERTGKPEAR